MRGTITHDQWVHSSLNLDYTSSTQRALIKRDNTYQHYVAPKTFLSPKVNAYLLPGTSPTSGYTSLSSHTALFPVLFLLSKHCWNRINCLWSLVLFLSIFYWGKHLCFLHALGGWRLTCASRQGWHRNNIRITGITWSQEENTYDEMTVNDIIAE